MVTISYFLVVHFVFLERIITQWTQVLFIQNKWITFIQTIYSFIFSNCSILGLWWIYFGSRGHEVGNTPQDWISVHCKMVGGNQRTQIKNTQKLKKTMKLHIDSYPSLKLNQGPWTCMVAILLAPLCLLQKRLIQLNCT